MTARKGSWVGWLLSAFVMLGIGFFIIHLAERDLFPIVLDNVENDKELQTFVNEHF